MRVIHLIGGGDTGGAKTHVLNLLKELNQYIDAQLFCFRKGDFSEDSHRDCDGDTGILDIIKAYHDCHFEGYIRPDHGRHLWGEGPGTVRPGYGLYDRALGIMYMWGIWDMLDKLDGNG